ncbi:MAG: methyltransferase [Thermoprotei archaeon]|nr:MAG: methyltransferase [Thermoprotei archaeon]
MRKCVKVVKEYGEMVRKLLMKHNLLDKDYRIVSSNEHLLIPVNDPIESEKILREHGMVFEIISYSPPTKKVVRALEYSIPSHDVVGKIVIVREKVVNEFGRSRVIEILRNIYPWIEAIYVKHGTETDYRLSRLELLWGKEFRYIVHKEYGLRFYIDIHRVYFNPRLSTEHRLLAESIEDGEIVFDLFSGFGGFSIHIASLRDTIVYANDINPYAIYCLLKSIILNRKKLRGTVYASILDTGIIPQYFKKSIADRIIANLPHRSIEFIETYDYLSHKGTILHLYIIGNTIEEILDRVKRRTNNKWLFTGYRKVLDYSPYTYIFRVDLERL